jgi:hypothetical protein
MAQATIILEDDNGAVACKVTFGGGWDAKSHAHQHANLMLKHMDEMCVRAEVGHDVAQAHADSAKSRIVRA